MLNKPLKRWPIFQRLYNRKLQLWSHTLCKFRVIMTLELYITNDRAFIKLDRGQATFVDVNGTICN